MPGCVLRTTGNKFQPKEFLEGSKFEACNIFCKGERKAKNSVWETSGFTLIISEEDGKNFQQQVQDTVTFLQLNQTELLRLRNFIGVEEMGFDFGIYMNNEFLQSCFFPPLLVSLAGQLEIALEISIYQTG